MSDCRQRLTGCSTCVICLTRSPPRRCESVFEVEHYHVPKYSRIRVARYDIFGKYGAIRQIRVGNTPETRGTAFVIYEDIFDAKNACDHLSGFNVCNRYDEYYALWSTLIFSDTWSSSTTRPTRPSRSWTLRRRRRTCRR